MRSTATAMTPAATAPRILCRPSALPSYTMTYGAGNREASVNSVAGRLVYDFKGNVTQRTTLGRNENLHLHVGRI